MKSKLKMLSVLAVAAMGVGLLSLQAHANPIPITGHLAMVGTATLDGTVSTANNAAVTLAFETIGSGAYLPVNGNGDLATWNSFGWNPQVVTPAPLWTFFDGGTGDTYSFTLTSVQKDPSSTSTYLDITGIGIASISGPGQQYLDTESHFTFTITDTTGSQTGAGFSFNSDNNSIPDGGLTVSLLGFVMVGFEGLRRKLSK